MKTRAGFTTVLLAGGITMLGIAPSALAEQTPTLTAEQLEAFGMEEQLRDEAEGVATGNTSPRALIDATLIVQEGDTPPGASGSVDVINPPFADANGRVGFTADVVGDNAFVWYDTGIAWMNSDAVGVTLTGAEFTMGVGNGGEFIYSPSTDGDDSVWTDDGQLAIENVQAPGMPAGFNSTFHSRPTMIPTGQAYWVAGHNDGSGGTSSVGRILYTSTDGTPATISLLIKTGDVIDGQTIDASGVDFDYDFSEDGSHHIHYLDMTGSTSADGFLYVDGSLVAQEGQPNGGGDNWDNFDYMSINDSGNYIFSGDTDGATSTDEFVAYNGAIVAREGDTIGGVVIASGDSVRGLAINNLGHAVVAWGSTDNENIFHACDAADLVGTGQLILSTGDELDFDGGGADATVTDIASLLHTYTLTESSTLFVNVDVDYGSGDVEAIIALDLPSCAVDHLLVNEIDYDQAGTDSEEFIEIYNPTAAPINLDPYALELVNGTGGGASIYNTIDLPDVDLAAGDYYVVCGDAALVPFCDLDVTPDTNLVQNGAPDAVGLRGPTGGLVDTVSYEGDSGAPYTEGSGTGLEDDPGEDYFSISRYPDGTDTDVNNVDLSGRCNSPGLPNFETTTNCEQVPVELMSFSVE
jgi:hypothetical protein